MSLLRTLPALLLLAAAAAAQAPFELYHIQMLSARNYEGGARSQLIQAARGPMQQAAKLRGQIRKWEAALRKRPKPAEARKLRQQINKARQDIQTSYTKADQNLLAQGLAPEDLERLKRMPRGDLREERYGHRLVLEAPNLNERQTELLTRLVAATDGAQRIMFAQEQRARRAMKNVEDKTLARQIVGDFGRQRNQIEKRFWWMAYYALKPDQMEAIREHFSPRYAYYSNTQQHLYQLPGVTASQATRIRAAFTEQQSELAADRAEVNRYNALLRDRSLDQAKRREAEQKRGDCQRRMGEVNKSLLEHIKQTLTEEQISAMRSRPPRLNPGDLARNPSFFVRDGMQTTAEQNKKLYALAVEIGKQTREIRKLTGKRLEQMGGEFGPDSPQSMTMQMMRSNGQAATVVAYRAAAHEAVVEVLDPDQICAWVVSPKTRP